MRTPVAIPSAHRHGPGEATVLEALEHHIGNVAWYVPREQESAYRRALPGHHAVVGIESRTVTDARNAIHADYAGGDVAVVEDDTRCIYGSNRVFYRPYPPSTPKTPRVPLSETIEMGFRTLDATGLGAWGLYPVDYSGRLLKPEIQVGPLFLVGHVIGLRLRDWAPRLMLPIKEDYELSALAIEAHGAVVRLEMLAAGTISGHGAGGTATYRTPELESAACDALLTRWPALFRDTGKLRAGLRQVKMVGRGKRTTVRPEKGWVDVYEEERHAG